MLLQVQLRDGVGSKNSSFLGIGLGTLAVAGCSVMRVLWGIYIIGHSSGFSLPPPSPHGPHTASWSIDTHSQHLTVHWISNAEWAVRWWLQQPQERCSILLVPDFPHTLRTFHFISKEKFLNFWFNLDVLDFILGLHKYFVNSIILDYFLKGSHRKLLYPISLIVTYII